MMFYSCSQVAKSALPCLFVLVSVSLCVVQRTALGRRISAQGLLDCRAKLALATSTQPQVLRAEDPQ